MRALVTGATGMLGIQICSKLVEQGHTVRALVRRTSDTKPIDVLGVEKVLGDVRDIESLRQAVSGADVVFHCAARLGEWGTWEDYHRTSVEGTANIIQAAIGAGVGRFLHVSSNAVYGQYSMKRVSVAATEETPFNRELWKTDYYTRSKQQSEDVVWSHYKRGTIAVTVVRPGWMYGPYDRLGLPRLARMLRSRMFILLDGGNNSLDLTYSGNVADAALLAVQKEEAAGRAYNLTRDGNITQREFIRLVADAIGAPHPRVSLPLKIVLPTALCLETLWRAFGAKTPPPITRFGAVMLGQQRLFDDSRAAAELGYTPAVSYDEGVRRAARQYLEGEAVASRR